MKERWLLLGMVSAGIAGCAALPEDVTKDGARFDFVSANTPYSAAICIARNARAMASTISGEERLLDDSSTEVVVRQTGGAREPLATAQIHRDGVLSKVSVSVGRSVRADPRGFANKLMAGC